MNKSQKIIEATRGRGRRRIKMTQRQRKLGVTEYGYTRGIIEDEFLTGMEAFLAKAATIKKGQYKGMDIIEMWFGIRSYMKLEQCKSFFFGLGVILPNNFHYTDTHGLDLLTVK